MNKDRLKVHDFALTECFVISGTVRCEVASVSRLGNGEFEAESVESVSLDLDRLALPELKAFPTLDFSLGSVGI